MEILPYAPEWDEACLELERLCPQGEGFRMRFERPTFRARSENYAESWLHVARAEGRIVGVMAMSLKRLRLRGGEIPAVYSYDGRVHPEFRREGVAQRLAEAGYAEGARRGATFRYSYCMADNLASRRFCHGLGMAEFDGFRHLVWPVFRDLKDAEPVVEADVREVHRLSVERDGPFDFYCDPFDGGRLQGHLRSLRSEHASCSIWSNAGIHEEVIERVPRRFRALGSLVSAWPLNRLPMPAVPRPGQKLRSWIIHDISSTRAGAARSLMHAVNQQAREAGVDYCYVLLPGSGHQAWAEELVAATPRWCSPVVPFLLQATDAGQLSAVKPDMRDF